MASRRTVLSATLAGTVAASLTAVPASAGTSVRILTIGDSIMGGPGNPLPADTSTFGPRRELDRLLTVAGVPHVLADRSIIGAQVSTHLERVAGYVTETQPDIVVVALGTNHCIPAATDGDYWWFQPQLRDLVARLRAAKTGMRILGSLIQYSTLPGMPSDRTGREHQINAWVDQLHVDGTVDGLVHFDEIPEWHLGPDGIHPKPDTAGRDWSGYDAMGVKLWHALAPLVIQA